MKFPVRRDATQWNPVVRNARLSKCRATQQTEQAGHGLASEAEITGQKDWSTCRIQTLLERCVESTPGEAAVSPCADFNTSGPSREHGVSRPGMCRKLVLSNDASSDLVRISALTSRSSNLTSWPNRKFPSSRRTPCESSRPACKLLQARASHADWRGQSTDSSNPYSATARVGRHVPGKTQNTGS